MRPRSLVCEAEPRKFPGDAVDRAHGSRNLIFAAPVNHAERRMNTLIEIRVTKILTVTLSSSSKSACLSSSHLSASRGRGLDDRLRPNGEFGTKIELTRSATRTSAFYDSTTALVRHLQGWSATCPSRRHSAIHPKVSHLKSCARQSHKCRRGSPTEPRHD